MESEKIDNGKNNKINKILIVMISVSLLLIFSCGFYLVNSFRLLNKYNVNSFKLDKFEIPTFNSAIKSKKKLVSAAERSGVITLKYDIKKITLNDVFSYLEVLSKKEYSIVNLEDMYIRVVNVKDNIQLRIKMGSNHLVFEYNIGIDKDEETDNDKKKKETEEKKSKEPLEDKSKME